MNPNFTFVELVCTLAGVTTEQLQAVNEALQGLGLPAPFNTLRIDLSLSREITSKGTSFPQDTWVTLPREGKEDPSLHHMVVIRAAVHGDHGQTSERFSMSGGAYLELLIRRARVTFAVVKPGGHIFMEILGEFAKALQGSITAYEAAPPGHDPEEKVRLVNAATRTVGTLLDLVEVYQYPDGTPSLVGRPFNDPQS